MNYEWAEAKVAEFIAALDQHRIEWAVRMSIQGSASSTLPQLDATINEKLLTIAAIATEINPGLNEGLSKIDGGYSWPHKSQLQASQLLLGAIRDRVELAENLGPQGPRLLAAQFHQWVWLPAANVWDIGHRRDAIQRAATSVFDDQLRAKVDRYNMKTLDLVGHVFNVDDPKEGEVRLRIPGFVKGTPEWTDAHVGTRQFGLGCVHAIRKLMTHGLDEPNEPVALEALAALSFLARRIDDANRLDGPSAHQAG